MKTLTIKRVQLYVCVSIVFPEKKFVACPVGKI